MFKKLIALLLLCVMLFSTACAVSRVDGNDNDDNSDDPLAYTSFIWGLAMDRWFNPIEGVTTEGDAVLARYAELREKYNLDFKVESINGRKCEEEITLRLNTMKDMFDFFWADMRGVGMSFQPEGVLYALEDIETIDHTDEKWGPASYISTGILEGKHYGFFPNEWPFNPEIEGCMIFNREMLTELNIPLPYEYFEQNAWNWDNFEDILVTIKDSGVAGEYETKPWTCGVFNEDAVSMFFANGLSPVVYNENTGEYEYGFDCPEGIAVLDFMSSLRERALYYEGGNASFIDGHAAFHSTDTAEATTVSSSSIGATGIASSNIVYGIITFPYGPNGSKETVSACTYNTTDLNFIFNMTDNDSETIGYFMEELYAPLDGEGYLNWKERCQEIVFYDEQGRDYDNYIYMLDRAHYDMSGFYIEGSSEFDSLYKKVIRGEMAASSAFDEVRDAINAEINQNIR